ncbi:hypothetical protein ACFSL4_07830 [Streptomyces caeni]|uniref:Transposase n=1 Tax=Streptomyces caeni TaxID=2307231 RepID=A0ABW4ILC8_9ACTN
MCSLHFFPRQREAGPVLAEALGLAGTGTLPARGERLGRAQCNAAEQTDEWTEQRRYTGPDILAECISGKSAEPGTPDLGGQPPALSH